MDQGARLVYGHLNYQPSDENLKDGSYFHPLILENISKPQPAYSCELFGPVFSLFKYSDPLDAVEIANDVSFGLSAAIFSKNIKKAERMGEMIEAGSIFINELVMTDPSFPNGGIKDSGYGRECYKDGLFEISNRKIFNIKH